MPVMSEGGEARNHGLLTDTERALIEAAERQPWTADLTAMLRAAVERRGIPTSMYDDCGMLADLLASGNVR